MSDPSVDRWRQRGHLYLWRFHNKTRDYPGWDCVLDEEGRQSLLELFGLMLQAKWKSKQTVKITPPPPDVLKLPGSPVEKWIAPPSIQIVFPPGEVPENYWRWSGDLQNPTLTLGASMLQHLRSAFEQVSDYGDFCVHADAQKQHGFEFEKMSIWFWPA